MVNVMDVREEEFIYPGTRMCSGCAMALIYRTALKALGPKTIITVPASCLTVLHGMQGFCTTKVSVLHTPFATAGAAASGIVASLEEKGLADKICVVAFAGDGGTADIGIQALSGAAERNTNIIYTCYDNEAYMNTGIQRSSSTPHGAVTTTTTFGKERYKKNVPAIMAAHEIPYVATCSISEPMDIYEKFKKAKSIEGCKYIQIFAPCPPGWGYLAEDTIEMARLAVKTGLWILYENENGVVTLSKKSKPLVDPSKRLPIIEYVSKQKRFAGISEKVLMEIQERIDSDWEKITNQLKCQDM